LLASPAASAQTFLLSGALDDADGPVAAGPLPFVLQLVEDDAVLWAEEQPAVDVVGGVFVVDVGSATPLPSLVPARARLRITVDGDELPLVPLAQVARSARASRAATTARAAEAERLQGHAAADFVGPDALATPGVPFVGFDHVTGVPAALANGDDGPVVTGTAGGVVLRADGTLALENVPGDRLGVDSINGGHLLTGSVGTRQVADGTVEGSHFNGRQLTRGELDADLTTREVRTRQVYRVDDIACTAALGTLTTQPDCAPTPCTPVLNAPGQLACGTGNCGLPIGFPRPRCANTPVGHLVRP
jgi:hypothetical protein